MTGWQQSWRETTLRVADIPKSDFALQVLSAWRRSTPVEPWTYNPLGMPAHGNNVPRALNSPYGLFTSMTAFSSAFGKFTKTRHGLAVAGVLASGDSLAEAWREIHALGWPATTTEEDWPAALLDMIESDYRAKVTRRQDASPKTTGVTSASPAAHEAMRQQAAALHYAAGAFNSGAAAIQHIMRRLS